MSAPEATAGLGEWRRGWPVVLLSALGTGVALMHYIVLGFMIGPIEHGIVKAINYVHAKADRLATAT